jgi:pilus assembly protein CpaC
MARWRHWIACSLILAPLATIRPALAQDATPETTAGASSAGTPTVGRRGSVTVEAGHGRVIVLPGAAANIYVADPKIAEVRPASSNSLFIFGTGVGGTTLAALDSAGALVTQLQITVVPNSAASGTAAGAIQRGVPDLSARLTPTPGGIGVDGVAGTPDEANRALGLTRQYTPHDQSVQNNMSVRGGTQVSLQVTIAEMSRAVTRELGVSWSSLGTIAGRYAVGFSNPVNFLTTTTPAMLSGGITAPGAAVNTIIEALAQDNLAHVLSQPNLTAISGESASFLVGGEFPIPVANTNNTITVAFKSYGIALAFVPTVLDSGRINLHVRTEVSALTTAGAVQVGTGSSLSISIPAITVRRADTTVEMGSGQSFVIAGLLQDSVTQQDTSIPWLGEVPVLGALFRSTNFLHNKSELVILITPVLVTPVDDRSRLHVAGENFAPANDTQRNLLNQQATDKQPEISIKAPGGLNGFTLQ